MTPQKLFLIFNHTFTPDQESDARATLSVGEIVLMPEDIRKIWGNVPPEHEGIHDWLDPLEKWLGETARKGDYVLIQGDFGACYLMVRFALDTGLIPVYSTTIREAADEHQPDGSVRMTHHFKHQRFRKYGQ